MRRRDSINLPYLLIVLLTNVFNWMLIHGMYPQLKSYLIIIVTEEMSVVLLNVTKAFDRVNYCKLFHKMCMYMVLSWADTMGTSI